MITSKSSTLVQNPSGVGEVVGWATYEDALDGQPVFTFSPLALGRQIADH